jgi:hypothetical protein
MLRRLFGVLHTPLVALVVNMEEKLLAHSDPELRTHSDPELRNGGQYQVQHHSATEYGLLDIHFPSFSRDHRLRMYLLLGYVQ